MNNTVKGNEIIFPILSVDPYNKSVLYSFENNEHLLNFINNKISHVLNNRYFYNFKNITTKDVFSFLFGSNDVYIVDSLGSLVNVDYLYSIIFSNENGKKIKRDRGNQPKSISGSKHSYGRYFRHPKTTQEARQNSFSYTFEWDNYEFKEPQARGRRNNKNLPNVYDDIYIDYQKSWKKHRKTQWK